MPICSKCHRPLTDPYSIAVGMGPECRGGLSKKGWKFPKPRYKVRGGRVVLIGMTGKVEPPTVNVTKDETGRMKDERKAKNKRDRSQRTAEAE